MIIVSTKCQMLTSKDMSSTCPKISSVRESAGREFHAAVPEKEHRRPLRTWSSAVTQLIVRFYTSARV